MSKTITPPRKKLIEHSLPLDAINAASSREKSVRHGHPSTLHLWWARRPLAACRAVLFGQLVDDPSAWPERFPTEEEQDRERRRLHEVVKAMVEWPKSVSVEQARFEAAIRAARWEIARSVAWGIGEEPPAPDEARAVLDYLQTKGPPVYDPFCGGGSIPLEAQRLGLRAYGADLNPVAVLITKALIEFPTKFANLPPVHPDAHDALRNWMGAQGLAEDVCRYGQWMREEAERRIGHLYPNVMLDDGSEAKVIAWLWARTVASPDPTQKGAHVPLVSSFVLSTSNEAIVAPVKDANATDGWRFEVKTEGVTHSELAAAKKGTKSGKAEAFVCFLSGAPIERSYIQEEGKAQRLGVRLMAIVADGGRSRRYLSPSKDHEAAAQFPRELSSDYFCAPDSARAGFLSGSTPTRAMITGGVCSAYGLETWGHLFTDRQLVGLTALTLLVGEARNLVLQNAKSSNNFAGNEGDELPLEEGGRGARAYADAVAAYLAFAVDRLAMTGNSLVRWNPVGQKAQHSFGRQAMPMVWDYAEPNLFGGATGSLDTAFKLTANGIGFQVDRSVGSAIQADAPKNNYPIRPVMISTDPPYYDNIAYADLSDFFYVWLRRSCSEFFPQMFRRLLTPKAEELVATPFRFGSKDAAESFFLNGMSDALSAMRAAANETDPLTVYYAFKQAEAKSGNVVSPGWAAFLQAIVDSGLQVDGTWPVRTEMATRQVAAGSNALAASVILVCRKRPNESSATSRREFLRELKPVMDRTIRDHQKAGIPLPDRRQAAIGPGIGVFSRYSIVREADDSAMRVATALALINKEIDALLAEGTEELDAETRFALEWYQLNGYSKKTAGQHNLIGQLQGLNLTEKHINATGLFLAKGGDAKLLSRDEMHESELERYGKPWRPSIDDNFTVWELAQHMARTLGALDGGIDAAGRLLAERRSATTDVLLIAERLFELATARGENEEALVWNELQTSWPEIENAADRAEESGIRAAPVQGQLGI